METVKQLSDILPLKYVEPSQKKIHLKWKSVKPKTIQQTILDGRSTFSFCVFQLLGAELLQFLFIFKPK